MPLNEQQQAAVEADAPRILVAAGAGTGKTQVLASRAARLLESGASLYSILCMTFTRRAAGEMAQRIKALTGFESGEALWIGTVHAIAFRMLLEYGHTLGYEPELTIYGPDDTRFLVDSILHELRLRCSINEALNALKGASPPNRPGAAEELRRLGDEYRRRLKVSQAIDYDGLLRGALQLLSLPEICQLYRGRFRHVLVDEVQDLAPEAWVILQKLDPAHLFLVGDDAQSIYSFAGADLERFFNCLQEGYAVFRLERNYRCTVSILALANMILAKNVRQIRKTLTTEKAGAMVEIHAFRDDQQEATWIAQEARRLNEAGTPWNQMAMLCRTNALAEHVSEAMTLERVPVQTVGGLDPFATDTGRLLIDLLRLMVNPHDEFALRRSLLTSGFDVRRLAWLDVERHTRHCSLYQAALELPDRESPRLVLALVTGALSLGGDAVKTVEYLVAGLRRIPAVLPLMAAMHVVPVLRLIQAWQRAGGGAVRDLLVFLAIRQSVDLYEPDQDAVAILTIHSAKGLEWPVVFVPGWEEGTLPFYRAMGSAREVEEERRVAHVAVTRAADRLYCTWAERRRIYQREYMRSRSKLLDLPPVTVGEEGPRA